MICSLWASSPSAPPSGWSSPTATASSVPGRKEALGSSPAPTELDSTDGIPFEAIAGLQPDLILALYAGPTQDDFTKLSAIADTVVFPKDYVDYGIPWDVQAEIVGRAVGRPAAMAEKVASSKKALTDAAAANPAFAGKTAMVITPYEGLWVYGAQDPRVRLMNELGFVNPPGFDELFPADSDSFGGNISPEKAEILDVDTLVCFADEGEQQAQIETKLFKTQDVYTQGRTVWLRTDDLGTTPVLVPDRVVVAVPAGEVRPAGGGGRRRRSGHDHRRGGLNRTSLIRLRNARPR